MPAGPLPPDYGRVTDEMLKAQQDRLGSLRDLVSREEALTQYVEAQTEQARLQNDVQKKITDALRTRSEKILAGTALLAGLGGLGGIAGFGGALGGLLGGTKGAAAGGAVGGALGGFVGAAAPGTMNRFNIAVEDVSGVIGQRLAPLFEQVLIPAIRLFGDFLQSVLPDAHDFREALAPLGELLDALREALAPVAAVIKDVLVVGLKILGEALKILVAIIKPILEFFGLLGTDKKLLPSEGAKARPIRFEDPLSAAKSVYQAAYLNVGAQGPDKQKTKIDQVLDEFKVSNATLKAISDVVKNILGAVGAAAKSVWDAINDIAGTNLTLGQFTKTLFEQPGDVFKQLAHNLSGGLFGEDFDKKNTYLPPTDKGRLSDVIARKYGAARRYAAAKGKAGGDATKDQAFLDMLKELRDLLKQMGASAKAQQDIEDELRDFARKASGRGIDGHAPGGGGR